VGSECGAGICSVSSIMLELSTLSNQDLQHNKKSASANNVCPPSLGPVTLRILLLLQSPLHLRVDELDWWFPYPPVMSLLVLWSTQTIWDSALLGCTAKDDRHLEPYKFIRAGIIPLSNDGAPSDGSGPHGRADPSTASPVRVQTSSVPSRPGSLVVCISVA